MRTTRSIRVGLTAAAILAISAPAWATIDNLKTFKQAYPGKTATCKVCHQNTIGKQGDLNVYGTALQKLKTGANAKKLTVEEIKAVENEDSDGDGASNLDEINAGTAPGDKSSVPAPAKR